MEPDPESNILDYMEIMMKTNLFFIAGLIPASCPVWVFLHYCVLIKIIILSSNPFEFEIMNNWQTLTCAWPVLHLSMLILALIFDYFKTSTLVCI